MRNAALRRIKTGRSHRIKKLKECFDDLILKKEPDERRKKITYETLTYA